MTEDRSYTCLLVEEVSPGQFTRRIARRNISDLPPEDVLVRVRYSSLNYKDALSASGNRGVTKNYPHTPGIDASGVVEDSTSSEFHPGDRVLIAAEEMGASSPGGYGQYIRVPARWLIRLPTGLSLRDSMAYGTAGLTAAWCVEKIQNHGVLPSSGEILVTGATGGVGSIAVGILVKEGYRVAASTGKLEQARLLRQMGASEVISRSDLDDQSGRPLLSGRWAGVVDTVGGNYLATAIRAAKPGAVVTACGNAASPELSLTVYPFILRGVSLLGIDALLIPHTDRERLWRKLGRKWKLEYLNDLVHEISLDQLSGEIETILKGAQVGRVVVNLEK